MERELSTGVLDGGALRLATRRMTHFYGYEPDPAAPWPRGALARRGDPPACAWREARKLRMPPDDADGGDAARPAGSAAAAAHSSSCTR